MSDWTEAETVSVAFALDGWKPTAGTRAAMARMGGGRPVFAGGRLRRRTGPPTFAEHAFPPPVGSKTVMIDYPGCESVLIPQHVATSNVSISMVVAALQDLRDPQSGGPVATDARGRSDQAFLVHVQVTRGDQLRCAWASGRDIYAISAPILVAAMTQLLAGRSSRAGVVSAGAAFDAAEFFGVLAPGELVVSVGMRLSRSSGLGGASARRGARPWTVEDGTRWT
jgi:hypothetical protein